MAIRTIVTDGDEILRKVCRPVVDFDARLRQTLDDMAETMRNAEGVGLAAPQIGILRRFCVIDVGDGLIELVNPVITEQKGRQEEQEGCLSFPGVWAVVKRPHWVKVEAFDRNGDPITVTGEGLLARALCHEIDHLDGVVFLDRRVDAPDDAKGRRRR